MISYTGAGSAPQHQIEEQSSTIMRLSMGSVMAYARSRFLPEFKGNIKDSTHCFVMGRKRKKRAILIKVEIRF